MLKLSATKISGLTMLELMLGIALGTIITAAATLMFVVFNQSNLTNITSARLNHELRTIVKMMSDDIRRAGYWADAADTVGTGSNTNPYMDSLSDGDFRINAAGDCVLLSYDFDKSGGAIPALNDANGDERFGYRLNNNTIESRQLFSPTYTCDASDTNWDTLSDSNTIQITNFNVSQTDNVIDLDGAGPGTDTLLIRNVSLTLTGNLINNPEVTETITTQVRVRNDIYSP